MIALYLVWSLEPSIKPNVQDKQQVLDTRSWEHEESDLASARIEACKYKRRRDGPRV